MFRTHYDTEPAPGLDPQIGLLFATLEDNTLEWREELDELAPSEEAVVWQPFEGGHSIGGLLLHAADVEAYWLYEFVLGRERSAEELRELFSEETSQYDVRWPTPPREPLAWYYAKQDAVRARTREIIAEMKEPARVITTRPDRDFTVRWVLGHVVAHEAYHGGQAVLLALMHRKMIEGRNA